MSLAAGTYVHSSTSTRPNFSLRFNRNRVVLLLFESKPTEKREQNNWRSEKNLDGLLLQLVVWAENQWRFQ